MLLQEKYAQLELLDDLLPLSCELCVLNDEPAAGKRYGRGENQPGSRSTIPPAGSRFLARPIYVERKEMLEQLTRAMSQLGDRCREMMRLKTPGEVVSGDPEKSWV